jgi:hypothetical protein
LKLGLQQLPETVSVIKPVDETGGLASLVAGIGVVLGDDELDVRSARPEVISDLLPQVGGVPGPLPVDWSRLVSLTGEATTLLGSVHMG